MIILQFDGLAEVEVVVAELQSLMMVRVEIFGKIAGTESAIPVRTEMIDAVEIVEIETAGGADQAVKADIVHVLHLVIAERAIVLVAERDAIAIGLVLYLEICGQLSNGSLQRQKSARQKLKPILLLKRRRGKKACQFPVLLRGKLIPPLRRRIETMVV